MLFVPFVVKLTRELDHEEHEEMQTMYVTEFKKQFTNLPGALTSDRGFYAKWSYYFRPIGSL